MSPPVLAFPTLDRLYTVETDANADQLGCILLQEQEDKSLRPVGYFSKTLTPAERNYDTTERECLAIIWAVVLLRPYLDGTDLILRTDHDSLKWFLE